MLRTAKKNSALLLMPIAHLTLCVHFFVSELINPEEMRFQRQCLLIKSITELEMLGENGKQSVLDGMSTLKACFKSIVEKAVQTNSLPTSTPVDKAADWLQNQFVGLRTFALMQSDDHAIETMIDKVLIDLKTSWPE